MSKFTKKQEVERMRVALFATYQINALAEHLKGNLPEESEYSFMGPLLARIIELDSVIMSVLGDDRGRSTEEMRGIVEEGRHD